MVFFVVCFVFTAVVLTGGFCAPLCASCFAAVITILQQMTVLIACLMIDFLLVYQIFFLSIAISFGLFPHMISSFPGSNLSPVVVYDSPKFNDNEAVKCMSG